MNQITELFKALSDVTRVRIINLIFRQDLRVCELVELLELSQPKISKHIAKFRQIDLLLTERNEQFIYYKFNHDNVQYKNIVSNMIQEIEQLDPYKTDIERLQIIEQFVCST